MKNKLLSFDEAQNHIAGRESAGAERPAVPAELVRMAVERELTERQRQCVELYYFQGMTMERTARELGLNKATVCRHLQKARGRVQRVLGYALWARRHPHGGED